MQKLALRMWPEVVFFAGNIVFFVDFYFFGLEMILESLEISDYLPFSVLCVIEFLPVFYGLRIAKTKIKWLNLLYLLVLWGTVIVGTHITYSAWLDDLDFGRVKIRWFNAFIAANRDSGKFNNIRIWRVKKPDFKGMPKENEYYLLVRGTLKTKADLEQLNEFSRKTSLRAIFEITVETDE